MSLLPRFNELVSLFDTELTHGGQDINYRISKKLPSELKQYVEDAINKYYDLMSRSVKKERALHEAVEVLLKEKIKVFILQTIHQISGRFLIYLVGTDLGTWNRFNIQPVKTPYLKLYQDICSTRARDLPDIFAMNELDWFIIPEIYRYELSKEQLISLNSLEIRINNALREIYEFLEKFDYSLVNRDLWKNVYSLLLPKEETNRLGFVVTPDEIVELILDLAGYTEEKPNLCKFKVLDPACGSGTFVVECANRLLNHFRKSLDCHTKEFRSEREKIEYILEKITENIHAIDIHPFATFLTSLNLLMIIFPLYSQIRKLNPGYRINFKVVTHDALLPPPESQPISRTYTDLREKIAAERALKYSEIVNEKFDYIIGNPPWGGVLRGGIGPLGDQGVRKRYEELYETASGKYDIYVLFFERGLKLLKSKGILALITQRTWLGRKFGEYLKKLFKRTGSIIYLVDLSDDPIARTIFPGRVNYPTITVFQKDIKKDTIFKIYAKVKEGDQFE